MNDLRTEPEIIRASTLKELGCPYKATDPRSSVWCMGFKAGVEQAAKIAHETIKEVFSR